MKKIDLKKCYFLHFKLIVIILVISLLASLTLLSINVKTDSPDYRKIKVLINEPLVSVERNFNYLSSPSINLELNKLVKKYGVEVKVLDLDGRIVYSSLNRGNSLESNGDMGEKVNIKYVDFEDDKSYFYTCPIVVNNSIVGNCIFVIPKNKAQNSINALINFIPLFIGMLVTFLILVRIMLLNNIYIHSPLKSIKNFIEKITRENYTEKLKYDVNTEVTSLCAGLELMQEELKYAKDRQRTLERERKELIACISHDLKTPISTIKAYTGAIKDGYAKDEATLKNYIEIIDEKADSILTLANDFFEHSKADLGELKICKSSVYSRKIFEEIFEGFKIEFYKKGIKFGISENIPDILINVDVVRIEQVLYNLFQNALKYTPENGQVQFSVENQEDFLKISVSDTGIGISDMDIRYIFEKFYRGEKEFLKGYQDGAGLGLYICKYIVEAHGGEIHAESRKNGSIFYFTIPKL